MAHHVRSHHDKQAIASTSLTIRKPRKVSPPTLPNGPSIIMTQNRREGERGTFEARGELNRNVEGRVYPIKVAQRPNYDAKRSVVDPLSPPSQPGNELMAAQGDIGQGPTATQELCFEFDNQLTRHISEDELENDLPNFVIEQDQNPMINIFNMYANVNNISDEIYDPVNDLEKGTRDEAEECNINFLSFTSDKITPGDTESLATVVGKTSTVTASGPQFWNYTSR